jgi:hypothetical protein
MYFVWYDDNPKKTVEAKIDEAVLHYKQRYGQNPNICMLNEAAQPTDYETATHNDGVKVLRAKNVPQNYFWVGNEA